MAVTSPKPPRHPKLAKNLWPLTSMPAQILWVDTCPSPIISIQLFKPTKPLLLAFIFWLAHWISDYLQLRGIALTLKPINRPHTSANIAALLKNILDSSQISQKIYCITADNAFTNNTVGQSLHCVSMDVSCCHDHTTLFCLFLNVISLLFLKSPEVSKGFV